MSSITQKATEKIIYTIDSAVEGAENAVANVANKAVEVAQDIAQAAEQYTDAMAVVEDATEGESSGTPESEDKTGGGEGKKLTMKDREAKLAQLRKKFVRVSVTLVTESKSDVACSS